MVGWEQGWTIPNREAVTWSSDFGHERFRSGPGIRSRSPKYDRPTRRIRAGLVDEEYVGLVLHAELRRCRDIGTACGNPRRTNLLRTAPAARTVDREHLQCAFLVSHEHDGLTAAGLYRHRDRRPRGGKIARTDRDGSGPRTCALNRKDVQLALLVDEVCIGLIGAAGALPHRDVSARFGELGLADLFRTLPARRAGRPKGAQRAGRVDCEHRGLIGAGKLRHGQLRSFRHKVRGADLGWTVPRGGARRGKDVQLLIVVE